MIVPFELDQGTTNEVCWIQGRGRSRIPNLRSLPPMKSERCSAPTDSWSYGIVARTCTVFRSVGVYPNSRVVLKEGSGSDENRGRMFESEA